MFAISEELAKSFTFERNKQALGAKVAEHQQRQYILMKKIKDTIDQNAVVKRLRREQRIKEQNIPSPQQHIDLSTFGKGSLESERG